MAGTHNEVEEQSTVSEPALSADSPTLSYSSRETFTQKNLLEETDIRMRDFQEITLFTTRDGRPLPPVHAKVEFLKPSDWAPVKTDRFTAEIFKPSAGLYSRQTPSADTEFFYNRPQDQMLVSEYHHGVPELHFESHAETKFSASLVTDSSTDTHDSKTSVPDGSESLDGLF